MCIHLVPYKCVMSAKQQCRSPIKMAYAKNVGRRETVLLLTAGEEKKL